MAIEHPLVVFVGPPAAGKSRLGKRVAKMLDVAFVDTDSVIIDQHGPISDIFEQHGEEYFRELERHAVIDALTKPAVVALGGGAVINPNTRSDLAAQRVALVTISADKVASRLNPGKRPLLTDGLESWKALVEQRQPWYDEVADVVFDTSIEPMDHIAQQIVQWIEREPTL